MSQYVEQYTQPTHPAPSSSGNTHHVIIKQTNKQTNNNEALLSPIHEDRKLIFKNAKIYLRLIRFVLCPSIDMAKSCQLGCQKSWNCKASTYSTRVQCIKIQEIYWHLVYLLTLIPIHKDLPFTCILSPVPNAHIMNITNMIDKNTQMVHQKFGIDFNTRTNISSCYVL